MFLASYCIGLSNTKDFISFEATPHVIERVDEMCDGQQNNLMYLSVNRALQYVVERHEAQV